MLADYIKTSSEDSGTGVQVLKKKTIEDVYEEEFIAQQTSENGDALPIAEQTSQHRSINSTPRTTPSLELTPHQSVFSRGSSSNRSSNSTSPNVFEQNIL